MLGKLSPRQREIAVFAKQGLTDPEIAKLIGISINTVKSHLKKIYKTLEVSGRTELAGLPEWRSVDFGLKDIPSIEGLWISKFEYKAFRSGVGKFVDGIQYDLEHIYARDNDHFFNYEGKNLICKSMGNIDYFHNLKCHLEQNKLVGIWINRYGINNIGCFQLNVGNNLIFMEGMHLGNASNNSVQTGNWMWLKVKQRIEEIDINNIKNRWNSTNIKIFDESLIKAIENGSAVNILEFP